MKRTILIAEDDHSAGSALQQMLEPDGYNVIQAESAEQAIALATSLQIDVFMLGIEMPRMNGIALCRELRAIERYRTSPVIFLAGNSGDGLLHEALSACGDDFLQKPFTSIKVRARLKIHIERLEYFQRLDRVRRILKQYLSKRTLDAIENTPLSGALPEPEERNLAIVFTDMRGFTAFSEETEPARLFSLVSELLADQVNIIHDYGGYVDKFGGDGVMAVFDGPDMVLQSCLCALTMMETAELKNSAGNSDIRRFGIGIHTGRAIVGNIGSPEHLDYSAIGTSVNLAARLCGQAQATSIAVSSAVRDAIGDDPRLHFHSERRVSIRGFKDEVTVYTLTRP